MAELLIEFVLRIAVGLVLVPVLLVLASPVVWAVALFRAGPYGANVRHGYRPLLNLWGSLMDGL